MTVKEMNLVINYLKSFGKIEIIKPEIEKQGSKIATDSIVLYLKEGSNLTEAQEAYCRLHNVLVQKNLF